MKRFLIIVFIVCSLFNKLYGQSPSAAIDSLIKYKVITIKNKKRIDRELTANDTIPYRLAILGGLENITIQKTFHVNSFKKGAFYSFSDQTDQTDKDKQDSINKSLRTLLGKINKAGVLTHRVYNYASIHIDSNQYHDEMQLIMSLAHISYRFEWLSPDKLLPVTEQLHRYKILNDSSFSRLENDIRNEKIESILQFNNYFQLDKELNLDKYPDDPHLWLEQMYRDISSILPGLTFTNFTYTTSPYTDKFGSQEIQYIVSLTCNGRTYKHKNLVLDFKTRKGKVLPEEFIGLDIERMFNKVLADEQSPYRLHSLMFSFQGTAGDNLHHPSFIALKEEQTKAFANNQCMYYVMASFENYDNTLTSLKIDSAISGWTKMGLFSHLSDVQINTAINDIEADDWYSVSNLLSNFPGIIYPIDSAIMSPKPTYTNMLKQLALISHGAFDPTKITQVKVKDGIRLKYTSGGNIHKHTFNTTNGWLDDGFATFVEHLAKENNLPGKFYSLSSENALIYLTQQQHDYAIDHKLLDMK